LKFVIVNRVNFILDTLSLSPTQRAILERRIKRNLDFDLLLLAISFRSFLSTNNPDFSRRMKSAGHVARMGEKRNAYRILVAKPKKEITRKSKI
jgi:hypothetical protein